ERAGPAKAVALVERHAQLLGDELAVRAYSLGMTARPDIVGAQRRREDQHVGCRLRRLVVDTAIARLHEPSLERARAAGAERDGEARRRAVGEEHRQLEK